MSRIRKERKLSYNKTILILSIFPIFCLTISLILGRDNLFLGFYKILKHPGVLITDFIFVGGLYSNFLNIATVALVNLMIIYFLKIPINGTIFSAYFLSIGFASFGKTVINIIPIYIGGLLYSKYEKINFKNIFGILMFSTGLSPVVSFFFFSQELSLSRGIILGILGGFTVGFVMPTLAAHMIKFHDGYNLYNVGFTAGILGTFFSAIIKGKGIKIIQYNDLSSEYDFYLKIILVVLFCTYIFIGYYINQTTFEGYDLLLSSSGRLITDYILSEGFGISLINCGILGLLSISLTSFLGASLNGPLLAGIFSVFAFGSLGKNPLNCIPVVIGVIAAGYLKIWDFNVFNIALSALFGTTLAPISGVYGPVAGILAGFLHLFMVNNIGIVHGGMNLYNNGFSGGLVASLLAPLINKFELGEVSNDTIYKKNN